MTAAKRPTEKRPFLPFPMMGNRIILEPDELVYYTRRTRNAWYLVKHLRSNGFITPAMRKLLAKILDGTIKVMCREPKELLSSHKAKAIVQRIREQQDVTALEAQVIAAKQHGVSPRTYDHWMWPEKKTRKRQP
jgi:hypothetical protein